MAESVKEEKRSLEVIMQKATLLTMNASQPAVLAVMAGFGYGPEKVKEGETKRTYANSLIAMQSSEYAEKTAATIDAAMVKSDFVNRFTTRVDLCRIVFKNNHTAREALELDDTRKRTNSGIVLQAARFYTNLLKNLEWVNELKQFSITEDLLKEDQMVMKEMLDAFAKQEKEAAEAHTATITRDNAIEDLINWTRRYRDVAKVALKNHPKLIEMLGM